MPGYIRTTEGEVRVFRQEEVCQMLECEFEDIDRWIAFDLIDCVQSPKGNVYMTYDDVQWLYRQRKKHPKWELDRILWRRYEDDHTTNAALAPTTSLDYDVSYGSSTWGG